LQAVLHADVVEWPKREARDRVNSVNVMGGIVDGSANTPWIGDRVVTKRHRDCGIKWRGDVTGNVNAVWNWIGTARLIGGVDERPQSLVTRYRYLLRFRESRGIGDVEEVRQEMAVGTGKRDSERIRERAGDQRAIEQAGDLICELDAAVGSARAPGADR